MLAHLTDVSVRSLLLAGLAAVILWVLRSNRTVALEHAVWTATVCGMLALFAFGWAPRLPLRILDAPAPAWPEIRQENRPATSEILPAPAAVLHASPQSAAAPALTTAVPPPDWRTVAEYAYGAVALTFLAQFMTGMFLVRRLIATAEGACEFDGKAVYESDVVTVPVTVGWLRPRIVLPPEWRDWSQEKLDAVLTHEDAHVRRHDSLVTALAAVNRCVFWFHPLAWILERRLALLAERACDEACVVALGDNERYAKLLLEMANVADGSGGRLRYHALTMAARSHLCQRIESLLILQDGRVFSLGITRMGWTAVILCAIPLVVCAGAVELEHQAQLILRMPRWRVTSFASPEQAQSALPAGMSRTDRQLREAEVSPGVITFQCEDLRSAGLELVPVTSPSYEALLTDIQHRLDNPLPEIAAWPAILRRMTFGTIDPARRATSAILLNHSPKSIAMLELVWRYEEVGGQTYTKPRPEILGKHILLPFSAPSAMEGATDFGKIEAYWQTILPGSKRYVGEDAMAGDNTDARLPAPDEVWRRTGGGGIGNGGGLNRQGPIQSITLALDGVFFTDGEFVGPDNHGLWESVTTEAKMRMEEALAAREGKARGLAASTILDEIDKTIGPAPGRSASPTREAIKSAADFAALSQLSQQARLWREFQLERQALGDGRMVDWLAAQADTRLPYFRKH